MSSYAMAKDNDEAKSADRALRWIGDLDHPFYDDERQRFIWYEASAIGFQLFLFANLAVLGAAAWIGGPDALPYVASFFAVQTVVALIVIGYVKRKHAEYTPRAAEFTKPRMLLYFGLLAFVVSGIARGLADLDTTETSDGFVGGFVEGARFGSFAMVAGILVGMVVVGLRGRNDESNDRDEM